MGSQNGSSSSLFSFLSYQTNYEDKIELIYNGYIEAGSTTFRPTVTLAPAPGQTGPLRVVAQQIQFELRGTSTGGVNLNGLFEFNPNVAVVGSDYSTSAIDSAGMALGSNAAVNALQVANGVTYVGGTFSNSNLNNIISVGSGNATSLGNGLNAKVSALYLNGSLLYAGGSFTNTQTGNVAGLNNVGIYSLTNGTWSAMGAGVNGAVLDIIPVVMNISAFDAQPVIAVSGYFTEVYAFDGYASYPVIDLAVWVPSRNNWLHNLDTGTISLSGRLTAGTDVPGVSGIGAIFAGAVTSQTLNGGGIAALEGNGSTNDDLYRIPINILPQQSNTLTPTRKRAAAHQQVYGVVTGLFYTEHGLNMTILGGHFIAQATNGSTVQNLAIIDGSNHDTVTGLAPDTNADAAILALDTSGTTLFAGGSITNAILTFDLSHGRLSANQPPALSGGQALVNAIAAQPSSSVVYVGGSFTSAGSLPCPNLCIWDTSAQQWSAPTPGLSQGSIITALTWASTNRLVVAGNLTLNGNYTTMASYDAHTQSFTPFTGVDASSALPGPVTAFTAVDNSYTNFFAAGIANANSTAFISHYDGAAWTSVNGSLGAATRIEGLQILNSATTHVPAGGLGANQLLLITGQLELPQFGNASAVLYNGTAWMPYALSNMIDGTPGTVRVAFVGNPRSVFAGAREWLLLSPPTWRASTNTFEQTATSPSAMSCSSAWPLPSPSSSSSSYSVSSPNVFAAGVKATSSPTQRCPNRAVRRWSTKSRRRPSVRSMRTRRID